MNTSLRSNVAHQIDPQQLSTKPYLRTVKKRTRVLLMTNSVAMGGMERHVELLARSLDRQRFEVYTISPRWPEVESFAETLQGVSDFHCTLSPDRRWGVWRECTQVVALYRQLRRWRIEVMHLHLSTFRGGLWAVLAARLAGVRTIYCTEHLAPERRVPIFSRLLRRFFAHMITGAISVSEKNMAERAKYLYTPSERTHVVVNGIDPDDFQPLDHLKAATLRAKLGVPADAPIIGSVVRFTPEKGLNDLIEALPMILEKVPGAYLLLVGDGPLRHDLATQAQRLGVGERLIFAGFHSDPRPYLGLMDAFVLPVPVGSMSIGLLEAMAMRRAVVITFGDPGEAVVHEESGLWSPPRDPIALAAAVVRLLSNPALAQEYGQAARQRVEEQFSAQKVAVRLAEIYNQRP